MNLIFLHSVQKYRKLIDADLIISGLAISGHQYPNLTADLTGIAFDCYWQVSKFGKNDVALQTAVDEGDLRKIEDWIVKKKVSPTKTDHQGHTTLVLTLYQYPSLFGH